MSAKLKWLAGLTLFAGFTSWLITIMTLGQQQTAAYVESFNKLYGHSIQPIKQAYAPTLKFDLGYEAFQVIAAVAFIAIALGCALAVLAKYHPVIIGLVAGTILGLGMAASDTQNPVYGFTGFMSLDQQAWYVWLAIFAAACALIAWLDPGLGKTRHTLKLVVMHVGAFGLKVFYVIDPKSRPRPEGEGYRQRMSAHGPA